MALERTFSIVKPDGVAKNLIGEVYRRFEKAGLKIIASKMLLLRKDQAEGFYAVHKARPFYADLVRYMTSGPVMVQVLEGENAIKANRDIMGATNAPRRFRGFDRGERRARLRRRRDGQERDRVLFQRGGALSADALKPAV